MTHCELRHLFEPAQLQILDELWLTGDFVSILKYLDMLEWDNLSHAMIIYYTAKQMALNKKSILETFDITPEKYDSYEMDLITKSTAK